MIATEKKRIGELVARVVSNSGMLGHTKLLKLLYVLEKRHFAEKGISFTSFDYLLWKMGPVNKFVYHDVKYNNGHFFGNYVSLSYNNDNQISIIRNTSFEAEGELTLYEQKLIDQVCEECQMMSAEDMINELHGPDSLWFLMSKELDLIDKFESGEISTTDYKMNFRRLHQDDEDLLQLNDILRENLSFQEVLTSNV